MGAGLCPPNLEPPSPKLASNRKMLQVLAFCLLGITILCFVAQLVFSFMFLLIMLMLFLAWRTFSWQILLFVFIYSCFQLIQVSISLVGMIQHGGAFSNNKKSLQSAAIIVMGVFFTVCVLVSHHVYRNFKDYFLNGAAYQNMAVNQPPEQPIAFRGQGVRIG